MDVIYLLAQAASASDPKMLEWISIFERLGIPVALLLAIILGVRRSAIFLAPRCTKLVDAHCEFIAKVADQAERTAEQSEKQTQIMAHQCDLAEKQGVLIDEIHKTIHKSHQWDQMPAPVNPNKPHRQEQA